MIYDNIVINIFDFEYFLKVLFFFNVCLVFFNSFVIFYRDIKVIELEVF